MQHHLWALKGLLPRWTKGPSNTSPLPGPSNTSPLVATSTKGLEAPHEAEPALSAPLAVKQATGAGGSKIDGIRAEGRANGAGQVEEIVPARGVQALVERAMVSSDSEDD